MRSAREHGYPHAQHRLAVAHATGLLGPIPPAPGDRVEDVFATARALPPPPPDYTGEEEEGEAGETGEEEDGLLSLGDELRSLALLQFAATGGDVAAAMALGYRCVRACPRVGWTVKGWVGAYACMHVCLYIHCSQRRADTQT